MKNISAKEWAVQLPPTLNYFTLFRFPPHSQRYNSGYFIRLDKRRLLNSYPHFSHFTMYLISSVWSMPLSSKLEPRFTFKPYALFMISAQSFHFFP